MKNIEQLKLKDVLVDASQVSLSIERNTLLQTILDVMVEAHLEGKPKEYQDKFVTFVDQKLRENRNDAVGMLVTKDPED